MTTLFSNNTVPQRIFRRAELPVADYLMSYADDLRKEFLDGQDLETVALKQDNTFSSNTPNAVVDYLVKIEKNGSYVSDPSGWKNKQIKYTDLNNIVHHEPNDSLKQRYPTACKLIEEYGNDCHSARYSLLGPRSSIGRHTDPDDRLGLFVKIHIPLIVPNGDVFFEVFGEEIDWSDIFAFNNQLCHSAYNNTDEWRLCFILDIKRTRIGIPPGAPYDVKLELEAEPFIRNGKQLTFGVMPELDKFL